MACFSDTDGILKDAIEALRGGSEKTCKWCKSLCKNEMLPRDDRQSTSGYNKLIKGTRTSAQTKGLRHKLSLIHI